MNRLLRANEPFTYRNQYQNENGNESNAETRAGRCCRCEPADAAPMVPALPQGTGEDGHEAQDEAVAAAPGQVDVRQILHRHTIDDTWRTAAPANVVPLHQATAAEVTFNNHLCLTKNPFNYAKT